MAEKNLGRVSGKSAYEVAVDNGYKGTEAEWLASLALPAVTEADNGKILQVVGGVWALVDATAATPRAEGVSF